MKYTEAVNAYISACKAGNKSDKTIESYTRTLRFFGDFLSSRELDSLESITPAVLLAWKEEQSASLAVSSLRLYDTHLKGFFDFCVDIEFLNRSPYKKSLMAVKINDADRKDYKNIVTVDQFRLVLTSMRPFGMRINTFARNRAILALLITSGIRCDSLCRITPADLDWKNGAIYLENAKGGKNGDVLFSDVAQQLVREYLDSGLRPASCADDEPLFGFFDQKNGGAWTRFSRTNISNVVEAAFRNITSAEGFRSHAMRHSFASLLKDGGMKDGDISILLMHSDGTGSAVTNRYIKRNNASVFQEANAIFNRLAMLS